MVFHESEGILERLYVVGFGNNLTVIITYTYMYISLESGIPLQTLYLIE